MGTLNREAHLDGCDDQQVLEIVVIGEGGVLEHNLLQQLNELGLQSRSHEALDSHADLLRVFALWQCR